ncbi:hypothetical protein ACWDR0_10020 [Streptomyces sp. NPDC003691]
MRNPVAAVLARLRASRRHRRYLVIVLVPPGPATGPRTGTAAEILRQRATATSTGTPAPPGARRLIVARSGLRFPRPVAARAARPGPAWTWIR